MRVDLEDQFNLNVSYSKMKRVKRLVLEKLEGSFIDDYNRLEVYAQELRDSNPGSDVVINISKDALAEGKRRFLRMYICFQALKTGWKAGLRPLIGLDGTFLKGKCKGILLVAMAQDSVKYFYPSLAWAVVDKETGRTWKWFMELLRNSLELEDGEGVTFMSDLQKGLLEAVSNVLPKANHRWCARNIEANWSKNWRGIEMKKLMWWCAWSTYEEEFKDQLKALGDVHEDTARELIHYPPQYWCRAYFDTKCKNHMVDNNFTESFNKWILEARNKPIIKMLEDIKLKVMNLLKNREEECRNWKEEISTYAIELYNDYRVIAIECKVVFNGDYGYEVVEGKDKHTVNLELKKCTCRAWNLTGIPCPHAIKALMHDKQDPLSEVYWWYSKEAYMLAYMHKLQPVRGEKFWKIEPEHAMEPPEVHKMVGRPKVKRKREKDEAGKREGVWSASRKGLIMTCGFCGTTGHNRRKCPLANGEGTSQTVQDVPLTAPQDSQNSEFAFMPTPGVRMTSPEHSSQFAELQNTLQQSVAPSIYSYLLLPKALARMLMGKSDFPYANGNTLY
ncbi:PREDICTED: uncharacterized protein LOC109222689, partial [Nicotiana attenuata]|uniref:uncharacterized protein LOC109222689 n=1 Tax=Nicotiana attenuata TaxID=49451 RepID=UPI000905D4E4